MPLRILANENFPGPVIEMLRSAGHDVMSVREVMRGAHDAAVLARAQSERRLVLTFDKDFGELAFRGRLPAECGIVLFRLSGGDPATDNRRAFTALTGRTDWAGRFSVITDDRVRMRPMPPP